MSCVGNDESKSKISQVGEFSTTNHIAVFIKSDNFILKPRNRLRNSDRTRVLKRKKILYGEKLLKETFFTPDRLDIVHEKR